MRAHRIATAVLAICVLAADASPSAWPATRAARLDTLGRGTAVVVSPDFSVPTNRRFYERLGFVYFEDASWARVLEGIRRHNERAPTRRIETVILMTHGANGHGLKLQTGKSPRAGRSYVSVGALQERLEPAGVKLCIIAACNSGRLFRPQIYKTIDTRVKDPLFLPATLGVVNASPGFDPKRSSVCVVRRTDNLKENASEGHAGELSEAARRALGLPASEAAASRLRFVVTDLLMQLVIGDPNVRLTSAGYTTKIVPEGYSFEHSDRMFERFVAYLDRKASRQVMAKATGAR
jgi:hypothetical protein